MKIGKPRFVFHPLHSQALDVDPSREILTNSFEACSCNVGNLVKDQNENVRAYPWTTEATQPVWICIVSIIQLDVVVTTVSLFLHLKRHEAELNAVALLGGQQPLTVSVTWVIIVSKLGVGVKVFLTGFCFQTTSTL